MDQTRQELKTKFGDGKRPSGKDFADLLDSFVNLKEDNIKKDNQGNLVITLCDTDSASKGTIRFHDNKIQYFDGGSWQDVGTGSGGGFKIVVGEGRVPESIVYNNGNVRIATGDTPVTAGAKLEVNLATSNDKVKLGNAAINNGTLSGAQFSHDSQATITNFALKQTSDGDVYLNAPEDKKIILTHGASNTRFCVVPEGIVLVGKSTAFRGHTDPFQVNGNTYINGDITIEGKSFRKEEGQWQVSDIRLKKDIQPFTDGLSKILQIAPVQYKYNGKAGTLGEQKQIGILGQEIEKILPYTISKKSTTLDENEPPVDLLFYNSSSLTYVLINAVQELSAKIDALQDRIKHLEQKHTDQ